MNPTRRVVNLLSAAALAVATAVLLTTVPTGATVISNTDVDASNSLTVVSCPTSTFCAAVDDQGLAFTESNGVWSSSTALTLGASVTALSCTSSSFCLAGDLFGNSYVYDGTNWVLASQPDGSSVNGISCASSLFCVAVTDNGNAFTTADAGQTWAAPFTGDGEASEAVSCASATFCVVTDSSGNAFTYDGAAWSSGSLVSTQALTSVSCPSAVFCAAVDSQGNVFTYDGSVWSASSQNPVVATSGQTAALTCPTASLCLIGNANGDIYESNESIDGGSWIADPGNPVDSGGGVTSISCPSASSCVAVDGVGHALVYVPVAPTVRPIPQSPLDVTTVTGTVGVPLTLETSGGTGAGAVIFQVISAGSAMCVLSSPTTLLATSAGSCTVTATKASYGNFSAASSSATDVTFVSPPVAPAPPAKKHPRKVPRPLARIVGPFANGSFTLTNSLVGTVDALAIAAQRDDDHHVTVIGYASSPGDVRQNNVLSLARARVVADALRSDFVDHGFSATVTAVGGGVGSAPTPAANRVAKVALR